MFIAVEINTKAKETPSLDRAFDGLVLVWWVFFVYIEIGSE